MFFKSAAWSECINREYLWISLQLDAVSSQLNSNDAFILVTPGGSFLWVGVGASDTEKQGAQQLCDILGVSASELSEGGETGEKLPHSELWSNS